MSIINLMNRNYHSVLYHSAHVLSRDSDHFHDKRHYHHVSCGNSSGQGIIFSLIWLLNDVFEKYIRHFTYTIFMCFAYFSGNNVQKKFANTKNLSIEKLPHYDENVCDKNL